MSSPAFALPHRIEFKPSRILLTLLAVLHLVAAFQVLFVLTLGLVIESSLVTLIGAGFYLVLRQHGYLNRPQDIKTLIWKDKELWVLETGDGQSLFAELMADSFYSRFLIILNFSYQGNDHGSRRRKSIVLLPDSMGSEQYRNLRARLRLVSL